MKLAVAVAMSVALTLPAAAQQAGHPSYRRDVPPPLLRQTKVSEDSALKVASARIPGGAVQAVELERERGTLIWSFEFKVRSLPGIYEVNVDAVTGALVGKVEHELPARHDSGGSPPPGR